MPLVIPTPQKPRRIELARDVLHEENQAFDGNILPGMLLELLATGKVQRHSTAGGYGVRRFAIEEALVSRNEGTVTGVGGIANVDTAYVADALVPSSVYRAGDRVNALLKAGSNYPVAAKLVSDGAGRLQLSTSLSTTTLLKQIIGEIDEFGGGVNLSATGAVDTRCSVRLW